MEGSTELGIKVARSQNESNDNYLGYDEDHNGEFAHFYSCGSQGCEGFNYLQKEQPQCPLCKRLIIWID